MKGCIYDMLMAPLEHSRFRQIRRGMLETATGHVLDIGSGTGASIPYYRQAESVTMLEPDAAKIKRVSRQRKRGTLYWAEASAEHIPFSDNTFDEAAAFLAFCTIPDPVLALCETARVVKPGGRIQLFEHVRMNDHPKAAALQDFLAPAWQLAAEGCQLNRPTRQLVEESPLHIQQVRSLYGGLFLIIEACVPSGVSSLK